MPEPAATTTLALAVWPPSTISRRSSYLAASTGRHRIAPGLAARAILAYTDPGEVVLDPHCGIGTVPVEAIQHGRRAIGIEPDPVSAALAAANLSRARAQGAPGRAGILEGNPDQLAQLLPKAGTILNPSNQRGGRVRRHPAGSAQLLLTATTSPSRTLLEGWAAVLAPGGFLLLVHTRSGTQAVPGLGSTVAKGEQAGLQYWQHVVALNSSRCEVLLHTDVLCFRKPGPNRPAMQSAREAA